MTATKSVTRLTMKNNTLTIIILFTCSYMFFEASAVADEIDYGPFPIPDSGYVTDLAGLLSEEEEDHIESWLYTNEKNFGYEIAVVTINSIKDYPGTPNASIESFATALFDKWGIGNMPRNDGVLLLIARQDRKARIELGASYGRNRDGDANRIMQRKIIPQFKKDRYAKGITVGVRAILKEFSGVIIIPGWVKMVIVGAIAFLVPSAISLFRKGKRGWGWICVGLIIILVLLLFRATKATVESLPEGSSAGGWGGGFGGGFSGGGGATGSW